MNEPDRYYSYCTCYVHTCLEDLRPSSIYLGRDRDDDRHAGGQIERADGGGEFVM